MRASGWAAMAALLAIGAVGSAGVTVDLDHAVFRANDSLAYVEAFASVQRAHLQYADAGDSLVAEFMLKLDVKQDSNVVLSDTFYAVDIVSRAEPPARGQFFPHVFRFIMKPGTYTLRAALIQGGLEQRDASSDTVHVRLFTEGALEISDIQLGCRMEKSDEPSPFVKNGIFVLPNPTRFYGTGLPMFYYYAEAYGLGGDQESDSHTVIHRIRNAESGMLARPETRRSYVTTGRSVVVADGFPVSTLTTGTYELELVVIASRTDSVRTRKKFWTYRPDDFRAGRTVPASQDLQARLLAAAPDVLDVMAPDSALKLMKYVLTKEQSKQAERLTPEGRKEFLQAYWRQREGSEPGAANRYFARVAEANTRWTYLHKDGWRTDRGRIFILYGEPDLTDRNYAVPDQIDNEIWQYDKLEGGVFFVFADVRNIGDLELVHSTKRGELYNPTWSQMHPSTRPREGFR